MSVFTRNLTRAGAIILAAAAVGFVLVFAYLKRRFDYPQVLGRGAEEVLPRIAGDHGLRMAWAIYAALPLALVLAGIAAMPLLEDGGGRGLARLGAAAAGLAGVAMAVGLARWPTLHCVLAERWAGGERAGVAAVFAGANALLGTALGELVGELALAAWFATIGVAMRRSERRALGTLSLAAALVVAVGALRAVTPVVRPVSAVANAVLPVWLLVVAWWMWRHPGYQQPQRSRQKRPATVEATGRSCCGR